MQLLVLLHQSLNQPGGSGSDDIAELGGHYVMVQGKFEPTDTDATQVNDFRRVGIVKNPTDTATNNVATISTARTTNALLLGWWFWYLYC